MRVALIAAARRAETFPFRVFSGIFDDAERSWNAGSRRPPISENRRQHRGKTPYRTRSERSGPVFRCLRLKTPMASRLDTLLARAESLARSRFDGARNVAALSVRGELACSHVLDHALTQRTDSFSVAHGEFYPE